MAKADGNLADKIAEKTTGSNVTGMDKKSILLETLKRRILSMELQPGTSIDEMTLCDEFGLSRSPVREIASTSRASAATANHRVIVGIASSKALCARTARPSSATAERFAA